MRLGTDGPDLPPLGLGCMSMSWAGRDDERSLRTLHAALDAGVTLVDTADRYGDGHNERFVGRALRHRRDGVVLATKVDFRGSAGADRPVDGSPAHLLYLHRVDALGRVAQVIALTCGIAGLCQVIRC